jgi:hypothetical protein
MNYKNKIMLYKVENITVKCIIFSRTNTTKLTHCYETKERNGKITRMQRKHVLLHPHRAVNCRATVEWGLAEVLYGFNLLAGGAIIASSLFLI